MMYKVILRIMKGNLRSYLIPSTFADFAEYKVENATYKEGIYAVPFDSGSAGLYYRTDYLSEAGYSEEDMKDLTWSQFVTIGEDVKEKTGKWFVAFIPKPWDPLSADGDAVCRTVVFRMKRAKFS